MTSQQPVVVGYDASSDADRGLDWAAEYAKLRGLPLEVYSSSGDLEYLPEWTMDKREEVVKNWLDRAATRLREIGVEDWKAVAGTGRVVPDLLEASKRSAMIILGAQGHGVVGGMVIGSVSQHLTRHASCPVVVVRGAHATESRRVVVGVDGSETSQKALEFAFEYASWTGHSVVAVHGRSVNAMNGPFDIDVAPAVAGEMDSAERLLSEAAAGLREKYPDVEVHLEAVPVPAVRALADASVNAALVVVGTRGRGGFIGLLLGSVSSTVLQHAECSVAVVR
jgi:nucleotide-binding universal stress UspA family protein